MLYTPGTVCLDWYFSTVSSSSLLSLPSLPQCLEGYGAPVQNSLTQFIHDKFLYDHKVAMDLLIQSGLLEPLLELAKVIT